MSFRKPLSLEDRLLSYLNYSVIHFRLVTKQKSKSLQRRSPHLRNSQVSLLLWWWWHHWLIAGSAISTAGSQAASLLEAILSVARNWTGGDDFCFYVGDRNKMSQSCLRFTLSPEGEQPSPWSHHFHSNEVETLYRLCRVILIGTKLYNKESGTHVPALNRDQKHTTVHYILLTL